MVFSRILRLATEDAVPPRLGPTAPFTECFDFDPAIIPDSNDLTHHDNIGKENERFLYLYGHSAIYPQVPFGKSK